MCTAAPIVGSATLTRADSEHVVRLHPSPNFGDRRGRAIDALILHYTGMATGEAALRRLLDPAVEVSAHYLVWENGRIDQLVAEADRAWHAGRSFWAGERDMNAVSIGIEIINGGHDHGLPPYPVEQMDAVICLAQDVCGRRAISPARVLGHSDIAPARKSDPGELFPWHRLAAAGLAETMEVPERTASQFVSAAALQDALTAIGYEIPATDANDATRAALVAFQRRWRPGRPDGVADAGTAALVLALAGRRRGSDPPDL